ncbi:MAG: glycosyltransferase, partial [Bacteroidota bacterium]|nr:glycosyltransferase [Bacteroidota bacterium]
KNKNVHITPFIENMSSAYQISDVVISRAGALAISELSFYSKPTLFIPSPNVSENHQEKNAESLVNENAALMVREDESDEKFWPFIKKLIEDDFLRKKLSNNISKNSYPKATAEIVNLIKKFSYDE